MQIFGNRRYLTSQQHSESDSLNDFRESGRGTRRGYSGTISVDLSRMEPLIIIEAFKVEDGEDYGAKDVKEMDTRKMIVLLPIQNPNNLPLHQMLFLDYSVPVPDLPQHDLSHLKNHCFYK